MNGLAIRCSSQKLETKQTTSSKPATFPQNKQQIYQLSLQTKYYGVKQIYIKMSQIAKKHKFKQIICKNKVDLSNYSKLLRCSEFPSH